MKKGKPECIAFVVGKHRNKNGQFDFEECSIERWAISGDTYERVWDFTLTDKDNEPHHNRMRELMAEGVQIYRARREFV